MTGARPLESLGLISLLLLGAACGKDGGGGSPVASDATIPVIANLRVALSRPCTISGGANGTVKTVAVDYTDADGNLRGGVLELTGIRRHRWHPDPDRGDSIRARGHLRHDLGNDHGHAVPALRQQLESHAASSRR